MKKKTIFALVGMGTLILAMTGLFVWRIKIQPGGQLAKVPANQSSRSTPNQSQSQAFGKKPIEPLRPSGSQPGPKACPEDIKEPLFVRLPIDPTEFTAFRPLGFITFPSHVFGAKHSNFVINQPGESKKGVKVYFPADGTVTQITSTKGQLTGFQVTWFPCQEFKSYFFHLGSISDAMLVEFTKGKPVCKTTDFGDGQIIEKCELKMARSVKVGDLVGENDGSSGVDWGGVDYRRTQPFANPSRYDRDWSHYVSPVEYLIPPLRTIMEDKLRSYDGTVKRTKPPVVGTIAQDVPGTAQGNWFLPGKNIMNTADFSVFLALLHDYIDPDQPLIVMGSSVKGATRGIYSFQVQSSGVVNRDFDDVKPDGQIYCFDDFLAGTSVGKILLASNPGRFLMTMTDRDKLKIEHQTLNCEQMPYTLTDKATVFER